MGNICPIFIGKVHFQVLLHIELILIVDKEVVDIMIQKTLLKIKFFQWSDRHTTQINIHKLGLYSNRCILPVNRFGVVENSQNYGDVELFLQHQKLAIYLQYDYPGGV